jgi:hypothetical protein
MCVMNERFKFFGKRVTTLLEIKGREVTLLNDPAIQKTIADAKTVFTYGWRFRAPDAVQKHAETIRAFFRPIEAVEKSSRETMDRLRQRGNIVVGVHVRRGDYRGWKEGKHFYEVSRYAAWMRDIAAQFPGCKVSFFVSSDEPRSQSEFDNLPVEIGSGPPVNDLWTLSKCDFVFGPPSTFSQWASFYGKVPLLHLRGNDDRIEVEKFRISFFEEIP